jgi:hypothetical protein
MIIAGQWFAHIYEEALAKALEYIGVKVIPFKFQQYFKGYPYPNYFKTDNNFIKSFYYRFQNKYLLGPVVNKLNKDFMNLCNDSNPDMIFLFRNTLLKGNSLKKAHQNGVTIFSYNNDDPFNEKMSFHYRHFFSSLKQSDHILSYRIKNIDDYNKIGYLNCSIFRSWYIKELNYPIDNKGESSFEHDVVFVGHFENDGRDEAIVNLINNGYNVGLYGTGWHKSKYYDILLSKYGVIMPLYKENYNQKLNKSKIALAFLSKINGDTYTRRNFEIPAAKTFMLSERTDDLKTIFTEDKEATYFSSKEELLKRVKFYLENDTLRRQIAQAGHDRLLRDGHEINDRAQQIIKKYYQLKSN